MSSCDAIRNRLLAEPNPAAAPADLQAHLSLCEPCRNFLARYEALAADIANLPAPSSELAKIALLESLTKTSPPVRPARAWQQFLSRIAVPLAATAAAIMLAWSAWVFWPRPQAQPEVAAARHQLLDRVVKAHARLASAPTPKARVGVLAELARHLEDETIDLMHAAPQEELNRLASLYEEVVVSGLVNQARQIHLLAEAPAERLRTLDAAADALAGMADQAANLARQASPQARAALERIARAAADSRIQLVRIARGEGA